MISRMYSILEESIFRHKQKSFPLILRPILTHGTSVARFSGSSTHARRQPTCVTHCYLQQSSIFRSLFGLMGVVGGAVLVVYLSPTVREYAIEAAPHLKPYIQQVDDFVAKYKQKMSSIELPKMPTLPSFSSSDHKSSLEAFSTGVNISPSFPSASDVSRQVAAIPEHLQDVQVDIKTAIRNSKKAAQEALDDIHRLQVVIESCISDYQNPSRKLGFANLDGDKLEAAQRKAKESHQVAQQHLSQLRSALDSAKSSVSEQNQDLIKAAIASYGDLAYDLSSAVTEVRRLQTQLAIALNFAKSESADRLKLQDDIKAILPKPPSGKLVVKEDGTEMTMEEVNTLLAMTLERIEKLHESLEMSGSVAKRHLVAALQNYKEMANRFTQEAIERAVLREQNKHELERLEWERQAKDNTEHELAVALARHSHHLAQMLRLKQEELEHHFDFRLREALAEQKAAIEGDILRWIRRMEAIEHVVDGRADIDRVAKQTQALWLAVEALAFALEMPFSKIGASGLPERQFSDIKPFYVSEPLGRFVDAVKETAGERHEFASVVAEGIPREALTDGVWTRQGLLQRFNKVYKTSCNVALVSETGGSLWNYAISWLQAKLLFDSLGRRRIISRLPGLGSTLLTPESEILEDGQALDTFCLLTSARAALMPEVDAPVHVDPTNCSDIEFAVRLLSQLKGQPAAVAADWIRDARRFLEVHQAVQALLAYATAQNFSVFDERL